MSARPPMAYDLLTKVLLVGDSGVGKTSLLIRFNDREFTSNHITTIGIDFRAKIMDVDGRRVKVQIWDTAGQERFRSITKSYYRGAHAILLIYDVSERTTFRRITSWLADIKNQMGEMDNFIINLVANKCDLSAGHLRQVSSEEGQKLAADYNMKYYETSAKTPKINTIDSVDHLFYQTIQDVLVNVLREPPPRNVIKPAVPVESNAFKDVMRKFCFN